MGTPAVDIKNVHFSYNGRPVLEDVSLTIDEGDFTGIIGPNGGGKTTLLRLILGQLEPGSGRIRIQGIPPNQARSRIGYVPQYFQFDTKFPVKLVDVVLMGRLGRHIFPGWYNREDREAALAALRELELEHAAKQQFAELSGGQRQRALIARALVTEPALLLLDEPTSNMDVAMHKELYAVLRELNKRMTIAVATHDTGFVSNLVSRVVCVNRQIQVHPTSDITGRQVFDLYGGDVSLVRHDHRCAEGGHEWPNS